MVQRCVQPFVIWPAGAPVAYTAGRLVEDSDPILKTHRHHFEAVEAVARRNTAAARVEAASAAPGELRSVTLPAQSGPADAEVFDPGEHNAPEVLAYLETADEAERERVLAVEAAGKARKGIVGDQPSE